mmetsp:Transcript_683/g.2448  ORF Transcript_683/g.2448 Transcript_683/m.2448 type:complete len:272 (-) Transcript_683:315-1130(-)
MSYPVRKISPLPATRPPPLSRRSLSRSPSPASKFFVANTGEPPTRAHRGLPSLLPIGEVVKLAFAFLGRNDLALFGTFPGNTLSSSKASLPFLRLPPCFSSQSKPLSNNAFSSYSLLNRSFSSRFFIMRSPTNNSFLNLSNANLANSCASCCADPANAGTNRHTAFNNSVGGNASYPPHRNVLTTLRNSFPKHAPSLAAPLATSALRSLVIAGARGLKDVFFPRFPDPPPRPLNPPPPPPERVFPLLSIFSPLPCALIVFPLGNERISSWW